MYSGGKSAFDRPWWGSEHPSFAPGRTFPARLVASIQVPRPAVSDAASQAMPLSILQTRMALEKKRRLAHVPCIYQVAASREETWSGILQLLAIWAEQISRFPRKFAISLPGKLSIFLKTTSSRESQASVTILGLTPKGRARAAARPHFPNFSAHQRGYWNFHVQRTRFVSGPALDAPDRCLCRAQRGPTGYGCAGMGKDLHRILPFL